MPTTADGEDDGLPAETHLGRTALRVADLEATTAFYRDVVGLRELRCSEAESADDYESQVILGAGGTPLLVLEADSAAPERRRSETGLYHTAFRVPTRAALGDALRRVREQWRLDGASDHRVSEALYLSDPEGNGVEIYCDYPREEWPRTDDGRVRMATDPLDLEAVADAATGDDRAPAGTDVGHVHLEVSSLETFREVYVDALGFEVQAEVPGATFVSAGGYHHHVGANTWNGRTEPVADGSRGLSWFEVVVPDADALEAIRERLAGRDVSVAETAGGLAISAPNGIEVRLRAASA
ncbi:VOC family protein [Halopiger thermotolerans]